MSELSALTSARDEILKKIREIESSCEGIENENNAKQIQELNLRQAQLNAQHTELTAKLNSVNTQIADISRQIASLSGKGIDKILEAIKKQRWFFIKNKPKVLLDRDTGILWANLNYYNIAKDDDMNRYSNNADYSVVKTYDFDGFTEWDLPTKNEFIEMIYDKSFPFYSGSNHYIKNMRGNNFDRFRISDVASSAIDLYDGRLYNIDTWHSYWLPRTKTLVKDTDYENNVSPSNSVYTEKERLQFTLDLMVQNGLQPIFDDDEITELYRKIYFEKPELVKKLQELQSSIDDLQKVTLISSEFDYTVLLSKYNIDVIDSSVIKYSRAVVQWINELMDKLCSFEKEKAAVIKRCTEVTESFYILEGNETRVSEYKKFIENTFSLKSALKKTKASFIKIMKEAERLAVSVNSDMCSSSVLNSIAETEKNDRPSFAVIAESTAEMLKDTLKKIELFELDSIYIENCTERLRAGLDKDYTGENSEVSDIFNRISNTILLLMDREYNYGIESLTEDEITIAEKIIAELDVFRSDVDKCAEENKTCSYSDMHRYFNSFMISVEDIIFDCKNYADREFIVTCLTDIYIPLIKRNDIKKLYDLSGCLVNEDEYKETIEFAGKVFDELIK